MPIDFLTVTERERLNRFPESIPDEDLRVFFTLSDRDTQEVHKQRGAANQLGFALQLCALRYLGFAPDDLRSSPRRCRYLCGPAGRGVVSCHCGVWWPHPYAYHPSPAGPSVSGLFASHCRSLSRR